MQLTTLAENCSLQRRMNVRYCKHSGGRPPGRVETAQEWSLRVEGKEHDMGDKNPKKKPKPKADKTKK